MDYKCVFTLSPYLNFANGLHCSAIASQESLSGLETEMRKLEGIVKEIVEEMDYLKQREERFSSTNGTCSLQMREASADRPLSLVQNRPISAFKTLASSLLLPWWHWGSGKFSILDRTSSGSISLTNDLMIISCIPFLPYLQDSISVLDLLV